MKAILIKAFGEVDQLYLGESKQPEIGPEEVLVKVKATALNRADLLQRRGLYPPPPGASEILGLEMAGEIAELGTAVDGFKVGDRVAALLPGGGYAEYVSVPQDLLLPLPTELSWEEGAALPEAFLTAWQAIDQLAGLQPGENILIHAGASGVGSAGIQLAKQRGARVWVTASAGKHDHCRALGADACIDYKTANFAEVLQKELPTGVNVIIDFVGAPYFHQNINALASDGRMVHLGFLGGTMLPELNLRPILLKRLKIMGSTLRARSLEYKVDLTKSFATANLSHFASGKLRVPIDRVFDWQAVAEAHQYMEGNQNKGKVVLRIS